MSLSHIVACGLNRVIGKDNKLLWHIPEDLKHFKKLTQHHTIIMGRKTYESIGKPLPNRVNIVISSTLTSVPGVQLVSDIPSALKLCNSDEEIFIIGGSSIYEQTLDLVDTIYLTLVDQILEGDSYYPDIPVTFDKVAEEKKEGFSFLTFKRQDLG